MARGRGRNFYWKSILIDMDGDTEIQPHDEWNYDLGSIQVYIYRMRAEEGVESGKDADDTDNQEEEVIEVNATGSGCVEGEQGEYEEEKVEEDEDEEMEGAERAGCDPAQDQCRETLSLPFHCVCLLPKTPVYYGR